MVVGNRGWAETLPEWLLDEVREERFTLGLMGLVKPEIEKVGDAEVCVYLYTLSMTVPMGYELNQVYVYLSSKLMKKRGRKLEPFMEEKLKQGLTQDEERELRQLKQMIYSKRGGDINHPLFEALKRLKKGGDENVRRGKEGIEGTDKMRNH